MLGHAGQLRFASCLFGEEFEVDGFAHGFVAEVAGMEMVAGVVERQEHAGVGGVGGGLVEVDDAVELIGGANPLIDGLAYGFAAGGLIFCTDEGSEGCSDDLDAVGVGAGGELAEADDEVLGGDDVVWRSGVGGVADVVDALKDDDVFDAGLGDYVAIEACEGVGAGDVVEDAIAADALVEYAEFVGLLVGLEAAGENVGPAGVGVAGAESAVGDAVAEGDDGGAVFVRENVDAFEEVPAEELLRVVERCGGDCVACGEVVGLVGEGVEGELVDGLVGKKEADSQVGEGCGFEGDRIADHQGSGWDNDGGLSAEGEWCSGACGYAATGGPQCDLCGGDGERVEAEFVGEDDAEGLAAEGDVDDLAKGGAGCALGSELRCGVPRCHGRGSPGADPVVGSGAGGFGCEAAEAEEREKEQRESSEWPSHDRP